MLTKRKDSGVFFRRSQYSASLICSAKWRDENSQLLAIQLNTTRFVSRSDNPGADKSNFTLFFSLDVPVNFSIKA